jgi:tripartite-type tricarboxylate transporter receptor subunit TctC
MMTHVDLIHVPYRSSFVPDLLSGQVQSAFSTVPQVIENIKADKLRAIGVTSATRVNVLADLPTIGETVPGYEADSWFGIVAPKGTPTEIVNALNDRINAIVAEPKVKIELEGLGVSPKSMTPIEFGKLIVDYTEKWAKVIKFAGIKAG